MNNIILKYHLFLLAVTLVMVVSVSNTSIAQRVISLPPISNPPPINNPFILHNQSDAMLMQNQLPVSPSGNILESLQGRVAGLQIIRTGQNQFTALIRGQGPPLYLLDGIPIDEDTINMVNQFDISYIEVLKNVSAAGIYGGRASYGVIAFYTRRGGEL